MAGRVLDIIAIRVGSLWIDVPMGPLQTTSSAESLRTTAASPAVINEKEVSSKPQDGFTPVLTKSAKRKAKRAAKERVVAPKMRTNNVHKASPSSSKPQSSRPTRQEAKPSSRPTTLGEWPVYVKATSPKKLMARPLAPSSTLKIEEPSASPNSPKMLGVKLSQLPLSISGGSPTGIANTATPRKNMALSRNKGKAPMVESNASSSEGESCPTMTRLRADAPEFIPSPVDNSDDMQSEHELRWQGVYLSYDDIKKGHVNPFAAISDPISSEVMVPQQSAQSPTSAKHRQRHRRNARQSWAQLPAAIGDPIMVKSQREFIVETILAQHEKNHRDLRKAAHQALQVSLENTICQDLRSLLPGVSPSDDTIGGEIMRRAEALAKRPEYQEFVNKNPRREIYAKQAANVRAKRDEYKLREMALPVSSMCSRIEGPNVPSTRSYNPLYDDPHGPENELLDTADSSDVPPRLEGEPSQVEQVLATNDGRSVDEQMTHLTATLQQKEDELATLRQQTAALQQRENELATLCQQMAADNARRERERNAAMSQGSHQPTSSPQISLEAIQRMIMEGVKAQYMQTHYSMRPGYMKPYPPEIDMVPFLSNYRQPQFTKFNGTGAPHEHVAHFLAACQDTSHNGALLLWQFVQTLSGPAFTCVKEPNFYHYHRILGHTLKECFVVKNIIQKMIGEGVIDDNLQKNFKKGKKMATSNVATFEDHMGILGSSKLSAKMKARLSFGGPIPQDMGHLPPEDQESEEAQEVDEIQLRSGRQLPDLHPQCKPPKGKNVTPCEDTTDHVPNVSVKYDVIAHLKKIPAMLSIYDALCRSSDLRKAFIMALSFPGDYRVEVSQAEMETSDDLDITFSDEDLLLGHKEHNRPLLMFGDIDDLPTNRIMIDDGSAINLLPLRTLKKIGYSPKDLSRSNVVIHGFNQSGQEAMGTISLVLKLDKLMTYVSFHVIDAATSYNALLGRPWLHDNKIVPSTLHQCIKYKNPLGDMVWIFADKKPFTVAETFYADPKFYIEPVDKVSKPKPRLSVEQDLPKHDDGEVSSRKRVYQYIPSRQRKKGEPIFRIINKSSKDEADWLSYICRSILMQWQGAACTI
ncbi:hypothetical protein EJB05_13879, partial [Eragrostis curvula]